MVSGAAKKKKKRANAAAASASSSSSSPSVPTSSLLEAVHARLARELHEKHDIVLVHTEEKGRCCLAPPQGFEPGRVLIEEEAYIWGNGEDDWCLECDDPSHASSSCPRILSTYPPALPPLLPAIEKWMEERLDRVQTLDRARAWIKALVRLQQEERGGGKEGGEEGGRWLDPLLALTACNIEECVKDAQKLAKKYPLLLPPSSSPSSAIALAAHLLSLLNTNSHELEDVGPGSALFLRACLLEHSCIPNCAFATYGTRLRLVTLTAIEPSAPLSIDYVNLYYSPVTARRRVLEETYGFICSCPACRGNAPDRSRAFTCPSSSSSSSSPPSSLERGREGGCQGGVVCPFGDEEEQEGGGRWECLQCGRRATDDEIEAFRAAEESVLEADDPVGMEEMDALLRATPYLHRSHFAFLNGMETAAHELAQDASPGTAAKAVTAFERVLSIINEGLTPAFPPKGGKGYAHHPELAVLLDRLAQVKATAGDTAGARRCWREAYQLASLLTGPDWVPTIDLCRLAEHPPRTREEVLSYYAKRVGTLKDIERELKLEKRASALMGTEEQEHRWAALKERLGSEDTRKALEEKGMAILDAAFGGAWAAELRSDIVFLVERGEMKPNQTRFGPREVYRKPFIWEADLHDPLLRSRVPALGALLENETLTEGLRLALPPSLGGLRGGMEGRALKVQRNGGGGGSFACHYDNPGRPSRRRVTCLVYLNPHWQEGDGGELVLQPFLDESPQVIAPLMDRMVIFRSDALLHRVLPAFRERYCLTVWLDGGEDVNSDKDLQLRYSPAEAGDPLLLAHKLRLSPSQRLLSRAVYAEEYEESLRECMAEGTPGAKQMLAAHAAHLEAVERNPPLASIVKKLREIKPPREGGEGGKEGGGK